MRKILAIIGRPGTGKSSLVRKYIEDMELKSEQLVKLVPSLYNKELDLHILGKYEEGVIFAGTDVFSMAVMPNAKEFVSTISSNILFEGDRLTSSSFFSFLSELPNTELKIFILSTSEEILNERYKERGSNQNETFLKGRATKIDNISTNMCLMNNIEEFSNSNKEEQELILENIKKFFTN